MGIALGILILGAFVVLLLVLLAQPEDETVDEELLGLIAANWDRLHGDQNSR